MLQRIKSKTRSFLQRRWWLILLVLMTYTVGVALGALGVTVLNEEQVGTLTILVDNFMDHVATMEVNTDAYTKDVLWRIWKDIGLIYFLSLTVIGLPLAYIVLFFRGFLLGFVTAFFAQEKALSGIMFAFLSMIPQNLITIPAFILLVVVSSEFSWYLLTRGWRKRVPFGAKFTHYTFITFALSMLASLGGLVEVHITPQLMKLMASLLG